MNIKALALAVLVVFGPAALLLWGLFVEAGGLPLTIWLILITTPIAALLLFVGWTSIMYEEIKGWLKEK
jgi:hypothetical protein